MLSSLHIDNFLTINSLEFDFETGFTALTGETGAGKSILIDALLLALGERADGNVVRNKSKACEISAQFQVAPESPACKWAHAQKLDLSEGEWIITRQLNSNGRSKTYLNGRLFQLQELKQLGDRLIQIHGQHAQHALLHSKTALIHLDRFAATQKLLHTVANAFLSLKACKNELHLLEDQEQLTQRLTFVEYQKNDLLNLRVAEDEIVSLTAEHKRLHHLKEYLEIGNQLVFLLDNENTGLRQKLEEAKKLLSHLPVDEPKVEALHLIFNEASIQLNEASGEASIWLSSLINDPERLNFLENRLSELYQASRKYRVDIKDLPNTLATLTAEYTALEEKLNKRPLLLEKLAKLQEDYEKNAYELRQARLAAAPMLAAGITSRIQELGMEHGQLQLHFTPMIEPERHGLDGFYYEVKTNPGTNFAPLAKVASGGELSRISLAIEWMTAERESTPTLFFDEIDVGIGGKTAFAVGKLLRQLGERTQVFCVTHQPQVAACAHHHVKVNKTINQINVFTEVSRLSQSERVKELARMLGGINITEQALDNAKSLLEEAL